MAPRMTEIYWKIAGVQRSNKKSKGKKQKVEKSCLGGGQYRPKERNDHALNK